MALGSVKRFTRPRVVVGFMIDSGFMSAVRVYSSMNSLEIDRLAVKEIENPSDVSEAVRNFFRTERLDCDALITCLPTSRAFVRTLPLGFQDVKKLEKIIKYQMEPWVPHPVDDLVVDFLAPRPGGDIVAAGVSKEVLAGHLAELAGAGLDPKAVALDDIGLFYLYLYTRPGRDGVVVNTGTEKRVIQVIREDRLEFIRILPVGDGAVDDVVETLGIYRLKNPDAVLEEVLMAGDGANGDGPAREVEERLGVRAAPWRPFDEMKHGLGEVPPELQGRLSAPLGFAVGMALSPAKGFDLRKEEFALKSSITPKGVAFYGAVALFILGFLTFNLHYKVAIQERHQRELQEKMEEVLGNTFPDVRNIIKGRELSQMRQKVEEETARNKWLEGVTSKGPVLDTLQVVSRSLVEFPDVRIDNFSMEGREIRLDGRASSFETVDRLEKKLAAAGYFDSVKLVGAKMDRGGRAVNFNFAMEKGA